MVKAMSKPEFDWTLGVVPSCYRGLGPNSWHPAIENGDKLWFWPNITMATPMEARHRATLALADAIQPATEVVAGWNIIKHY